MPEIITTSPQIISNPPQGAATKRSIAPSQTPMTPDEYVRREKRKNNGLVEKFYNWAKNLTGLGVGTKKLDVKLQKAKNGEISKQNLQQTVHKYQTSQENSAQLMGDAVSIGASGLTFFYMNKGLKYAGATLDVNKPFVDKTLDFIKQNEEKIKSDKKLSAKNKKLIQNIYSTIEGTINTLKSNKKLLLGTTLAATFVGGITKYWFMKFNRTGSDEFKVDEKIYGKKKQRNGYAKKLANAEKKKLNKERRKTNFKNFLSGAINGLMTPALALGGIVGAPIYFVGNSLNRYFVANKTDKNKSLGGYISNLGNDALTTGLVTAGIAIPFVKKANFTKAFNKNIKEASSKLANATLKEPDFKGQTAYKKLEQIMLGSKDINSIISDSSKIEDKITKLTKENIFAVKFKQISEDGSELTSALREKCPPTRTLEEAQKYINKNAGAGFEVKKLLGVGTVAETYLAKDSNGKEVCVKIIKEGVSKEKILADKQKFVEIVKNIKDKSPEEIEYLLKNIDDLADGILKEVDLKNEMDAALKLAKNTRVANVVKPIEVKNNVYIMEKANGVSLDSFIKLNQLFIEKKALELEKNSPDYAKRLKEIEDKITQVKSRMPDFKDVTLDKKDSEYLLNEYQKVFIEQFHKIDKNGKVIHADIHPGNIFIDPNALRTRKGKVFTLIDTGNTINMNVEQSMHALNLTNYVNQGNAIDIAEYVIEGAKLPQGMTKEQAIDTVVKELKTCFFDKETKLQSLNDKKVLDLADQIMEKHNIIPGSTQLNLNKSRQSAKNSLTELQASVDLLDLLDVFGKDTTSGKIYEGGKKGFKKIWREKMYDKMVEIQEKANLKQLDPAQRLKQKFNPNAPKKESEDYLTYKLKQWMIGEIPKE